MTRLTMYMIKNPMQKIMVSTVHYGTTLYLDLQDIDPRHYKKRRGLLVPFVVVNRNRGTSK